MLSARSIGGRKNIGLVLEKVSSKCARRGYSPLRLQTEQAFVGAIMLARDWSAIAARRHGEDVFRLKGQTMLSARSIGRRENNGLEFLGLVVVGGGKLISSFKTGLEIFRLVVAALSFTPHAFKFVSSESAAGDLVKRNNDRNDAFLFHSFA